MRPGGALRRFRLQQQAQIIEFVETAAGDLRRGAVADQMGLDDQPSPSSRPSASRIGVCETLSSRARLSTVMREPGAILSAMSWAKIAS